jgi:hypothetical protein
MMKNLPTTILLLFAAAAIRCTAFISSRQTVSRLSVIRSSSDKINIALVSSNDSDDEQQFSREGFDNALQTHPFCKMTGITLSISDVSVTSSLSKEDISLLQNADIACFSTITGVKSYLNMLDEHFNVAEDISDEERRQLPNRPDLVGDMIQGLSGSVSEGDSDVPSAGLMAACPNTSTARECLNSGRWMSNHIYYPKDAQKAVELKTEAVDSENSYDNEEEEGEEDIDLEAFAASIVQAAGDVYERKFWGGGW